MKLSHQFWLIASIAMSLLISSPSWSAKLYDIELFGLKQSAEDRYSAHEQGLADRQAARSSISAAPEPEFAQALQGEKNTLMFEWIQAEPDPLMKEALLSVWLSSVAASSQPLAFDTAALESLVGTRPVIRIPHHEMVHHSMPAFNIAQRASNLLALQRRHQQAALLTNDSAAWSAAWLQSPDSEQFKAAELAFKNSTVIEQQQLISRLQGQLEQRPNLSKALSRMLAHFGHEPALAADIIQFGTVVDARAVLRMISAHGNALELAELALTRPEIGGLAIQVWLDNGGVADQKLWSLLDDPYLGADAARALAVHSKTLTTQIQQTIESSKPLARARMLLALKLRNSDASISLLNQLIKAEWMSDAQLQLVSSWL